MPRLKRRYVGVMNHVHPRTYLPPQRLVPTYHATYSTQYHHCYSFNPEDASPRTWLPPPLFDSFPHGHHVFSSARDRTLGISGPAQPDRSYALLGFGFQEECIVPL